MPNTLADGAVLCADGFWRWGGVGKPIGWTFSPGITIVNDDGSETVVKKQELIRSSNVRLRDPFVK